MLARTYVHNFIKHRQIPPAAPDEISLNLETQFLAINEANMTLADNFR